MDDNLRDMTTRANARIGPERRRRLYKGCLWALLAGAIVCFGIAATSDSALGFVAFGAAAGLILLGVTAVILNRVMIWTRNRTIRRAARNTRPASRPMQ